MLPHHHTPYKRIDRWSRRSWTWDRRYAKLYVEARAAAMGVYARVLGSAATVS